MIVDYKNSVGEGPQWNPFDRHLYWLDIEQGRIYRYEPSMGSHGLFFETDAMIGGMTLQADGTWVLFMSGLAPRLEEFRLDIPIPVGDVNLHALAGGPGMLLKTGHKRRRSERYALQP